MNIQVFKTFLLTILFSSIAINAFAENKTSLRVDDQKVYLDINLNDGEKIYWIYPGKIGLGTKIDISESENINKYLIDWPWPNFENTDNGLTAVYHNNVSIPINIEPKIIDKEVLLKLKLNYLLCDDKCTPKEVFIEEKIKGLKYEEKKAFEIKKFKLSENKSYLNLELISDIYLDNAVIASHKNLILPESSEINGNIVSLNFNISNLAEKDLKNTRIILNNSQEILIDLTSLVQTTSKPQNPSLMYYLLLAFIGGVIMNLMPCVLPVLTLKIYSIINSQDDKERRTKAIVSLCAIFIFFIINSILAIFSKKLGILFSFGMTLQNPYMISGLIIVITILISSLREKITIEPPHNIASSLNNISFSNKYLETFTSTIVSTILATPCTAPFIGSSISFAVMTSDINIILIFTSLAAGFGLPYLLILFWPGFIRLIPKPGAWQKRLNNIFALLLIATIIWLLSVLSNHLGYYSTLGFFLSLVLFKYFLESNFKFAIKVLCTTFMAIICLLAPSITSVRVKQIETRLTSIWRPFTLNELHNQQNLGRVIFVDITADWCVTCKVNKYLILETPSFYNFVKKNNIVCLRGDFTKEDKSLADYLKSMNANGIPFNALYLPGEKTAIILPVFYNIDDLEIIINNHK